jgi:hypothetical protein
VLKVRFITFVAVVFLLFIQDILQCIGPLPLMTVHLTKRGSLFLNARTTYELPAENQLGETMMSTPATFA